MPVYTCPECRTKVQTAAEAAPGQKFACPECDTKFAPRAEALAFKDDDPPTAAVKAGKVSKGKLTPTAAAAKPATKPVAGTSTDLDNDTTAYGVIKESEEEERLAKKNMPKVGAIRDRFKKSARGPAAALLVVPSNLLLAQGGLLALFGLSAFIYGWWPLLFTDVAASDEEIAEQIMWVFIGIASMVWGGITCFGAVQMVSLGSYGWAVVGAAFGLLPLLAGIFALTTLRDPRVLAGFAEPETGPIQTEADKEDGEEDDEDEEEDDEEEEEERAAKKKKR